MAASLGHPGMVEKLLSPVVLCLSCVEDLGVDVTGEKPW